MCNCLRLILLGLLMMELYEAQPAPGKPTNIRVLADSYNIGVQWDPPITTFGTIQNYVVRYAILPNMTELSKSVDGMESVTIIPVDSHAGRLFRIRVGAQNEAGMGPYSNVRYIRINCSGSHEIYPNTSIKLRSLGYQSRDEVEEGVFCSWKLKTAPFYVIETKMEYIELLNNSSASTSVMCSHSRTYVEIGGIGKYCDINDTDDVPKTSNLSEITVTLKTGIDSGGRGFELTASSVIRLPGPPRNIHVSITDHAVIVTWQQPMENTLPVTSYIIRYGVLKSRHVYRVTLSATMRMFSLNLAAFEGRFLSINISAAIGYQEGAQSKPVYFRAPCRRTMYIETGKYVNITSPHYPEPYPESTMCTWEVTSEPEVNLLVTCIDFRLVETPSCDRDYVLFTFNDRREAVCSRMRTSKTIDTNTSSFNMTFVSDEGHQTDGFFIRVDAQGKKNTTYTTNSTPYTQNKITTESVHSTVRLTTTSTSVNASLALDLNRNTAPELPTTSMPNVPYRQTTTVTETRAVDGQVYMSTVGVVREANIHIKTTELAEQTTDPATEQLNASQYSRIYLHYEETTARPSSVTGTTVLPEKTSATTQSVTTPGFAKLLPDTTRTTDTTRASSSTINDQHATTDVDILNLGAGLIGGSEKATEYATTAETATVTGQLHTMYYKYIKTHPQANNDNGDPLTKSISSVNSDNGKKLNTLTTPHQGLTNMTMSSERLRGLGPHLEVDTRDYDHTNGIIAGCVTTIVVLSVVLVGFCRYRRNKLKMKIDTDSNPYGRGQVELHDIIQRRLSKQSNSYETFGETDVQQTAFTTSKKVNGRAGKTCLDDTFKSVNRSPMALRKSTRMRSCPDFNRRVKVHKDVNKTLSAFKFIEDQVMLETQIQRKQRRQRTISL